MKIAPRSLLIPLACAAALPATAGAQELWRQNPINSFGGLASQDARNTGGIGWFAEVADNFTVEGSWTIGQVEFWGGYATDVPGNTHGFMIRFYEDNAGTVGSLVSTQDVTDFSEVEYYNTEIPGLGFLRGYHYTVDLVTPVQLSSGSYWMSVVAILDRGGTSNEPQWGWIQSQTVNFPFCQQWFFSPGNFVPQTQDVSFVLTQSEGGCEADFNGDNQVDFFDYLDFVAAFDAEDPSADFNGDNQVDFFDYLDFASAFDGCQ